MSPERRSYFMFKSKTGKLWPVYYRADAHLKALKRVLPIVDKVFGIKAIWSE